MGNLSGEELEHVLAFIVALRGWRCSTGSIVVAERVGFMTLNCTWLADLYFAHVLGFEARRTTPVG